MCYFFCFQLLLVFMCNEYVQNDNCRTFFEYAKNVLGKSYILVAVGSNFDWQNTDLGAKIGTEVNCICYLLYYEKSFVLSLSYLHSCDFSS